jgi:tRNA (cytidine/uridine-2'-O-)-methyltransferase
MKSFPVVSVDRLTLKTAEIPPAAASRPAAIRPLQKRRTARSGGVLLAPLPNECKPAIAPAPKGRISRGADGYKRLLGAANSAFSARGSALLAFSLEHDLFRKPVPTFRDHALAMRIALYQPDIAQNTGTILRLAACLGVEAHIIEPAGFATSDRAFRRAGMDYLDHVRLVRHVTWAAFETWRRERALRLVLFTTRGERSYLDYRYARDDILLFGRESAGVPEEVHAAADARLLIPMRPGLRSLNVAMACAIVVGEALRQTGGWPSAL